MSQMVGQLMYYILIGKIVNLLSQKLILLAKMTIKKRNQKIELKKILNYFNKK